MSEKGGTFTGDYPFVIGVLSTFVNFRLHVGRFGARITLIEHGQQPVYFKRKYQKSI